MNTFADWKPSPKETFVFLRHAWSITKAKEILAAKKKPSPVVNFKLSDLSPIVSREVFKDGELTGFTLGISVDWGRIREDMAKPEAEQEIDLKVPILLALKPDGDAIPIDGYHRIGKAMLLGNIEELPTVILSAKDSRAIKL